jgi:light-regulated signal transduction histidine kinase (bacteriophytochrome)
LFVYSRLWGPSWWIWHLVRLTAYGVGVCYFFSLHGRTQQDLKTYAVRLERSNRELEQFAYVASHDMQEPLRKIQAFGERLQTKYADALPDTASDYIERMRSAAERMRHMVAVLLDYSRISSTGQHFTPVDLAQVTREAVSDLEVSIEQAGGRVEVGDLPLIEADALQLRRLLLNLIGNGLKFHRPDTPPLVKVHGARVEAADPAAEERVQITVEDNGIGFEEKHLDRVFEPFQRLHGRDEYEGTGIGLAICRKIVERHGGSITARSAPGHGTTMIATLPVRQARQGRGSETVSAATTSG